jgi:hypothetical protein
MLTESGPLVALPEPVSWSVSLGETGWKGQLTFLITLTLTALVVPVLADNLPFNGHGDHQTDAFGYYYIITGEKFPTGPTPNGDNASGGTFRFLTDDPAWDDYPIDNWQRAAPTETTATPTAATASMASIAGIRWPTTSIGSTRGTSN